jgi:hypothetical protein
MDGYWEFCIWQLAFCPLLSALCPMPFLHREPRRNWVLRFVNCNLNFFLLPTSVSGLRTFCSLLSAPCSLQFVCLPPPLPSHIPPHPLLEGGEILRTGNWLLALCPPLFAPCSLPSAPCSLLSAPCLLHLCKILFTFRAQLTTLKNNEFPNVSKLQNQREN